MSWGVKGKDLVPFSEQRGLLKRRSVNLSICISTASSRIVGTTKFNKWLDNTPATYKQNENKLTLSSLERSQLGYKAIVNANTGE
ncbi:hypothetical protein O9992_19555 [Vibrio lentus]|nr:hypothetical protein [Vibrio lentus]